MQVIYFVTWEQISVISGEWQQEVQTVESLEVGKAFKQLWESTKLVRNVKIYTAKEVIYE